jgi:hypothetical protein
MAFQVNAFQNSAFQMPKGIRDNVKYWRRYLMDISEADLSTHFVSYTTATRDAGFITYMRRYLGDVV